MAFSLSPSVQVREFDLSQNVPNLPSARTGMVLRADTGPCNKIVSITNESELINTFGKPTSENYNDWFQAWNFLQYASSLYIVRPMDANKLTKNAGVGLTGSAWDNDDDETNFVNMYNKDIAEDTLFGGNFSGTTHKLYLINKNITSNQDLAFGICSSKKYFKSPIGLEYYAIVSTALVGGSVAVTASARPTLTYGSKVILNGDKLAVVQSVSQGASDAVITFDRAVSASDVAKFYGVVAANSAASASVVSFKRTGFTLERGVILTKSATTFFVDTITPTGTDTYDVAVVKISGAASGFGSSADEVVYSSSKHFAVSTSLNTVRGDFGINAGESTIKLNPGFVCDEGDVFTLTGDSGAATVEVASIDRVNNTIRLTKAVSAAVSGSTPITGTNPIKASNQNFIIGVNNYNLVYDEGLISKSRKIVTDSTGKTVTILAEKLVTFDRLVEFEPVWANEEFVVVILKKNTDGKYALLDKKSVSYIKGNRDSNGRSNFVEDIFFSDAKIPVYAKVSNTTAKAIDSAEAQMIKIFGNTSATTSDTVYPLKAGTYTATYDGNDYTEGDIINAQDLFGDPESFDINILITHEKDMNGMSDIAADRKDCVAIVCPTSDDAAYLSTASNSDASMYLIERFGTQTAFDEKRFTSFGTYSSIYGNMKYQYDKFNDVNRWIGVGGDVAGLFAQTDANRDPWWAVAGSQRGVIRNAIKLAFNANKQNRDDLYVNAINPIISIPGEGNAVVYGQKTATAIASAFDRLNVRRLLIFLEKAIATAARTGLFEFNDAFTRQRLFSMIEPFLRTVKARRGLYDYKLIIDDTNNTSEVIDANGLVIDVYLKPTKVAEFIQVNAVVVKTGVSFSEVVGTF